MSAEARARKHRSSQNKLNGGRGTSLEADPPKGMFSEKSLLTMLLAVSPPISNVENKELQEHKKYWKGPGHPFLNDMERSWAGRGG